MAVTVTIAVYLRDPSTEASWPFDVGDDPSFRASDIHHRGGGVLTWGVCRPDVRNRIGGADLVLFFAADSASARSPVRYCFVGYGTVANAVSQPEIWTTQALALYRRYANLLIAPRDGHYVHEEMTPRRTWHKDWLWRIADQRCGDRDDYVKAGARDVWDEATRVNGRRVLPIKNYLLFHGEGPGTRVLGAPPVIATWKPGMTSEKWEDTQFAVELKAFALRGTRGALRTTNPQQPHRHITHASQDAAAWRTTIDTLVRTAELSWRTHRGMRHARQLR